jgi:hypothetical protein
MPKLCCIDCFEYDSIKRFIKENGSGRGYCDFCQMTSRHCIEPSELADLFTPLVNLYEPIVNFMPLEMMKDFEGQNVAEKLSEDWTPFSNDILGNVENLLSEMFPSYDPKEFDGIDLDNWVENSDMFWGAEDEPSIRLEELWKVFCKEIIHENRYFPQKAVDLNVLNGIPILVQTVRKGEYLFRARKSSQEIKISPKKMGKPPANLSQPGRANPTGIPYLYLSTDLQTAIHEIRPNTTEFVTIGKFKILKDLQLFDLSNPRIHDPFLCGEALNHIIQLLSFFRMLGHELSKPINPKEKELHYIPTQYLCEFLKHEGYDGVSYKSHFGPGQNVALFNEKKVKCTRSVLYKIDVKPIIINP